MVPADSSISLVPGRLRAAQRGADWPGHPDTSWAHLPCSVTAFCDAVLVGGNGQHYQADFDAIAGYANFDSGTIHVAQGDTVTGAVTFQMPDGVTISRVQWDTLSGFGSTVEWNVPG
jgi:hypothetical protein